MPVLKAPFNGYSVKFNPFYESRLAVATAQNFGILSRFRSSSSLLEIKAGIENAGLLELTKVGSRKVVQISAGFMIFFSIFGKFGAVLASIPSIFAAKYCVPFAYVASAGLGLLQFCNLNIFRTKFILGFSIFIGLSICLWPWTCHSRTCAFNVIMQVIFSSAAKVGIMAAFFLDSTHSYGHASVRRDSGRHWWEKFRVYHTDTRTEEFYSLPYNLSTDSSLLSENSNSVVISSASLNQKAKKNRM